MTKSKEGIPAEKKNNTPLTRSTMCKTYVQSGFSKCRNDNAPVPLCVCGKLLTNEETKVRM
jgi:hypothetical protein